MKRILNMSELQNLPTDSIFIDDDLAIMPLNDATINLYEPKKMECAAIVLCVSGACRVKINLQEYDLDAPMLATIMPGQIIEHISHSINFSAMAVVFSKRFIDIINLPGWQQYYMAMYNNPVVPLDEKSNYMFRIFIAILHHAASDMDNPFRLQVIENLIRVFYYGGAGSLGAIQSGASVYKNGIVERFMALVQEHYRTERLISFYANKLCITPKYLSKIVKENTGRSAGEWIENHVILEARAMLQSSDMTIQQIATSLNFPNQSFFGKYFKRATGDSPKQYRSNRGK
jgi:AraC-like DNA-binding protein